MSMYFKMTMFGLVMFTLATVDLIFALYLYNTKGMSAWIFFPVAVGYLAAFIGFLNRKS